MTIAIGEFDFVRAVRVPHNHGADLTAAQKQRSTAFEVLRTHILQQCDHVVHFDSANHGVRAMEVNTPKFSNREFAQVRS